MRALTNILFILVLMLLIPFTTAFSPKLQLPCELTCARSSGSTCPESTNTMKDLQSCIAAENSPPTYFSCMESCEQEHRADNIKTYALLFGWLGVSISSIIGGYRTRHRGYGKVLIIAGLAVLIIPLLYLSGY